MDENFLNFISLCISQSLICTYKSPAQATTLSKTLTKYLHSAPASSSTTCPGLDDREASILQ